MTGTVTHSGILVLVVAVFLASAVEMVEALTIVLAVGVTRGGGRPSKGWWSPWRCWPAWWWCSDRPSSTWYP